MHVKTKTFSLTEKGKYFNKIFLALILTLSLTPGNSQPIKRPLIVGIADIAFKVSDIKKSKLFYEGMLGYLCLPALAGISKESSYYIQINQRQTITIQSGLKEGEDERLVSVSFETTNVESMRLYLTSKGISVPDAVTRETETISSFSVIDPDGHQLKFIQYTHPQQETLINNNSGNLISDRILHVGLTIKDSRSADSFYKDILGFSEIWRGGANDSTTNWINMRIPESTDYLEYMLVNTKPTRQQLGSYHHVALLTKDMQKSFDILRARAEKLSIDLGSPRIGRNNKWQLNLFDPVGTRIELMEPFTMR